jgi:wyosine [tRNA(Phe)-imidazoG37] synthetase (radical SAM superfamily)
MDILAPSLDAGDPEIFGKINRPHQEITFERLLEGIRSVADRFEGRLPLEVMLARDVNDSDESVRKIGKLLESVKAESVDINTPVRPPPDRIVSACDKSRLEAAKELFGARAQVVASYDRGPAGHSPGADEQKILELVSRRPCTVEDISASLGIPAGRVSKILEKAAGDGLVKQRLAGEKTFFFAKRR